MSRFAPPYLGAAYYPEAWPPDTVDEEIRLMREAGMNVMRVAEFAWSSLEPEEGRFELNWLRRVVGKLADAGIATIMCTPSCTPPAWLTSKYPEVLVVDYEGVPATHGYRRHVCPNNPLYREYCGRIAQKLAEMFGQDTSVIGWQIDNEIYLWKDWGCYCPLCIAKFREHLQRKFGSLEALNSAWGTHLWSQTYSSFDQIPAPVPGPPHHPSLQTAWILFQNESIVDYVAHQAAILHEHTVQPVGTDMMPMLGVSYEQIHRHLDIVQYNHYDTMDTLWRQVFWMDYVRPLKAAPFWNTETSACWNGGVTANGYREPGFCKVNSWLPIALGGEANLYWLWRAHSSGQELMHGSVVSSAGRPLHMIGEVRETGQGFQDARDFINETRPSPPGFAMHLSTHAWAQFRFQPVANGFDYLEFMIERVYRHLMDVHLRADIIDPAAGLNPYRIVFSPFLSALEESGLAERLRAWIENGGTWVAGPLSDIRDLEGAKPRHAPFTVLEDWAGVHCRFELPAEPREMGIRWDDGAESYGSLWHAAFETRSAGITAAYTEGPLKGLAAVTETHLGKGRIVLLGTLPAPDDLQRMMLRLCAQSNVHPAVEASPNVLAVPRTGETGNGMVVLELHNRKGELTVANETTDLLSGKMYSGRVEIQPCQVLVLRSSREPAKVQQPDAHDRMRQQNAHKQVTRK